MKTEKNKEKEKEEKQKEQDEKNELVTAISGEKEKEKKKGFFSHLAARVKEENGGFLKKGPGGLIDEYRLYKSRKGQVIQKYEAYETVVSGATDTVEFYVLLILSCLIATAGLYLDSPAVIIGAMIVAPLMGPLFGFSAGMLWGSGKVLREAVTTLFKGTVLVVGVTAAMSFFIPGISVTGEMLSRIKPSFFDVMVALCCGLIGAYAFVNKRVSSAIPGVAISVALMPPLCTVGIGIGLRNWDMAKGASLLYGINLTGISLAALVVFYLVRLHPKAEDEGEFLKARVRAIGQVIVSLIIICLISVPLVYFAVDAIQSGLDREVVYSSVHELMPDDRIYSLNVKKEDPMQVEIILLHRQGMPPVDPVLVEKSIQEGLGRNIRLTVYSIGECTPVEAEKEEAVIGAADDR
ncbi:MAG: DUF389 domain-containing protein [Spirochaetales bacterium]|nr:DUF389 domain-containing protein [Spirochaetales bacterium]